MKLSTLYSVASFISVSLAANCNPLTSDNCPSDAALGTSFREDFTNDAGSHFSVLKNQGDITFGDDGVALTLNKRFNNPSLVSNFYILFGKVEVVLKAAQGTGIISSFYLQSDDLDEIDIELFGADSTQFQSNYFIKGNTATYDRGGYHDTSSSPVDNYHTYTIDWTPERLNWDLDGQTVRTLPKNGPQGFPQSPMQIFAGVWAGGDPTNPPGTIEWAGGLTDYSKAPFSMHIKSVIVSDYSSGNKYTYSDKSGLWTSIESDGGKIMGRQAEADSEFMELQNGDMVVKEPITDKDSESSSSVSSSSVSSSSVLPTSSSAISSTSTTSSATSSSEIVSSTESVISGLTKSTNTTFSVSSVISKTSSVVAPKTSTTIIAPVAPKTTSLAASTSSTRNGITFIKTVPEASTAAASSHPEISIPTISSQDNAATHATVPALSMLVMLISLFI
jgi:Beta-glucanase/Beta-glucan synthetase